MLLSNVVILKLNAYKEILKKSNTGTDTIYFWKSAHRIVKM